MLTYEEDLLAQTFMRPCDCTEDNSYKGKSYCYVEGTERDLNVSDTKTELTENIWYEIKPPSLFAQTISPLVTAREIYITRIKIDGKRAKIKDGDDDGKPKEKMNVSVNKKKSAVRFLSKVHLE